MWETCRLLIWCTPLKNADCLWNVYFGRSKFLHKEAAFQFKTASRRDTSLPKTRWKTLSALKDFLFHWRSWKFCCALTLCRREAKSVAIWRQIWCWLELLLIHWLDGVRQCSLVFLKALFIPFQYIISNPPFITVLLMLFYPTLWKLDEIDPKTSVI